MSLTNKRKLRTGASVWQAYSHRRIEAAPLRRGVTADVIVVGAGISGAMIAYALSRTGFRTLVLDRRARPLQGSTAASTALLQYELDTPLTLLSRSVGTRKATRIWQCSRAAVNELGTQTTRLGIRCHLHARPSLYLAGDLLDEHGLQKEVRARQRAGLPSELLSRRDLKHHFGITRSAAILSHGNFEADPVSLAAGFLQKALSGGARLHAPTEVTDLHASRHCVTLATKEGIEIAAEHVVFCTGYEPPALVPQAGVELLSTWALATPPQNSKIWPQRALLWEASEPYLYARATHDGRIICGGEDEAFRSEAERDAQIDLKVKQLQNKLQRLVPGVGVQAEFSWAGNFNASKNGVPLIGRIPGHPRCYAVLGYGGNGITFSMLAAMLLSRAISSRARIANLDLFDFR